MADPQLTEYVRAALAAGAPADAIRQQLRQANWSTSAIDETLGGSGVGGVTAGSPATDWGGKLLVFWFFLSGVLFILLAVAVLFFIGPTAYGAVVFPSTYLLLVIVMTAAGALAMGMYGVLLLQIRSALRRGERAGFQAARLHLLLIVVGAVSSAVALMLQQQWANLGIGLVGLLLNVLALWLLLARRQQFSSAQTRQSHLSSNIAVVFLFGVICFALGLVGMQQYQAKLEGSQQDAQTQVTGWETYTDLEFGITMQVPAGWHHQTYGGNNGSNTYISFGPGMLPDDAMPVEGIYFNISRFPTTNQEEYENFIRIKSQVGDHTGILAVSVGGVEGGVEYLNTVAVEHAGYVYSIHLEREGGYSGDFTDISQQVLSSFQFIQ